MPGATSPERRTLVVRLDSFGDVLVCGPAVRAVAARSRVTMLCGPHGHAAAELLPGVADVIEHDAGWIAAAAPPVRVDELGRLVHDLAGRGFHDAVVLTSAYQSSLPTALVLRLAGIPRVVGLSVDFPGSLLDRCIREDLDVHEVERALAIVRLAGYALPPGDDGRLRVATTAVHPIPGPLVEGDYVVVHPGASVPARTLPASVWGDVVAALVAAGHRVVVTGTAGEGPSLPALDGALVDLVGRTDAGALARVLAGARAVCVGNTGAMHLAAAVGTPVCAVFAPTVPLQRWRPWGVPHVVLGDQEVECRSCRARTCPLAQQRCVAEVTPEAVVDAVGTLLTGAAAAAARPTAVAAVAAVTAVAEVAEVASCA
jgi:ADP-heptose:LPS heptosyltransferase